MPALQPENNGRDGQPGQPKGVPPTLLNNVIYILDEFRASAPRAAPPVGPGSDTSRSNNSSPSHPRVSELRGDINKQARKLDKTPTPASRRRHPVLTRATTGTLFSSPYYLQSLATQPLRNKNPLHRGGLVGRGVPYGPLPTMRPSLSESAKRALAAGKEAPRELPIAGMR